MDYRQLCDPTSSSSKSLTADLRNAAIRCAITAVCLVLAGVSAHASSPSAKGGDDNKPETEFYGIVQKMPAAGLFGDWQVAGRTLHVTSSSEIRQDQAPARVGGCAQVKGFALLDGSVESSRIDMRSASDCGDSGAFRDDYAESKGLIESLPAAGLVGDWKVAGRTVKVSASTSIKQESQRAVPGACVEVKGQLLASSSIAASTIEVKPAPACTSGSSDSKDSVEAYGLVRKMPASGITGDWQIGDWIYHVTSSAVVKQESGRAMPGSCVEVKGERQADDSINVQSLEVKSAAGMCISPRSVLNAASLQGGRVSPGEMLTLFGFAIGPAAPASPVYSDDGRVLTSTGGVRVLFDD